MLSRKHYEAIAKIVLAETIPDAAAGFDEGYDAGATAVAYGLADYFAADNPNFDRQRFLKASGCSK